MLTDLQVVSSTCSKSADIKLQQLSLVFTDLMQLDEVDKLIQLVGKLLVYTTFTVYNRRLKLHDIRDTFITYFIDIF